MNTKKFLVSLLIALIVSFSIYWNPALGISSHNYPLNQNGIQTPGSSPTPTSPPLSSEESRTDFQQVVETLQLLVQIIIGVAVPTVLFYFGNKFTKTREIEQKLRDDRVQVYNDLLEPYMLIFTADEVLQRDKKYRGKSAVEVAIEKLMTIDYQKLGFKLSLIGSDEVIKAYNDLMQLYYRSGEGALKDSDEAQLELMNVLGKFILEIRKSVGNENSKLHPLEMLEWKIKDLRRFQKNNKYPDI
jgi:hypothetical protein